MGLTSSISLNGFPGTGKTYATAKIVTELGLNAVVLDFEGKYGKTISQYYPEMVDQFEVIKVMKKKQGSKTDIDRRPGKKVTSADMKISFKNSPDYLESFITLKDEIVPAVLERNDFQVLIMDGATPILRNNMGLEYWKMLHPDRENPMPEEWGAMNDVERAFIEAGIGWAEENNGLFIVTGQMKDDYKGDKKVGEIPGISVKCQHSIDVVLELKKEIYRDHTEYKCVCLDSIKGQFTEPLTLERHVFDVVLERGLISY